MKKLETLSLVESEKIKIVFDGDNALVLEKIRTEMKKEIRDNLKEVNSKLESVWKSFPQDSLLEVMKIFDICLFKKIKENEDCTHSFGNNLLNCLLDFIDSMKFEAEEEMVFD